MADFDSSLPVRTQTPGDVAAKIVDGLGSNLLTVDSSGKITVKLDDSAGVGITSTLIGSKQSLDVNVANTTPIPVSGTITTLNGSVSNTGATPPTQATYIGGSVTTAAPTYVTGQMNALSLTTGGLLRTDGSGAIQPVSQSTSPWITKDLADGSVTGGTAGTFSLLMGGQFNTALPTLTAAQQAALQLDASGRLIIRPLTAADTVTAVQSGVWAQNITQVLGTAVSATNALPTQLSTAGAVVSSTNPLPVILDPAGIGAAVVDYKDAASIAAGSSDNHDYTVTAAKTLHLQGVESAASGKAKMVLSVETGVGTGVFTIKVAQFNSTATPNMSVRLASDILVAAGVRVRVAMSNRDLLPEDLYSTIIGFEV